MVENVLLEEAIEVACHEHCNVRRPDMATALEQVSFC
jgi:hypothetical protein